MTQKKFYDWKWVDKQIDKIAQNLERTQLPQLITGIPRGGLIPAVLMSHRYNIPFVDLQAAIKLPEHTRKKVLVVDDIADSGVTLEKIEKYNFMTATLARRYSCTFNPLYVGEDIKNDDWLVFPWESKEAKTIQDYLV